MVNSCPASSVVSCIIFLCFVSTKGGYYHLPVMHCGQTILSTAEFQRVTHFKDVFKVSPRGKPTMEQERYQK